VSVYELFERPSYDKQKYANACKMSVQSYSACYYIYVAQPVT